MRNLAGASKYAPISLSSLNVQDEQKGRILRGSKCCSCWVLNLYLIIINVFREKECNFWLISGWLIQYLPSLGGGLGGLWVVWLVCGWFVGGLTGFQVVLLVSGWFQVLQLTISLLSFQRNCTNYGDSIKIKDNFEQPQYRIVVSFILRTQQLKLWPQLQLL